MRIFKTLIGRTLIATLGVLGVCLIALLHFANTAISERNEALFNNNIRLFTTFLAEQIDTGTRLKRGAMIAPQLESVFANKGLHVVSLRVTHVEGVEVAHMISPDFAGADLPTFAQPDFSETTSVSVYPLFDSVRAPIILGTGDDAALVGELAVLWDKSPYIASTTQLLSQLRTAFVVMAAVLAIAVGFTLNTLVSRPLKKTLNALMAVSAGKDQVDLPTSETIEIRQMVNAMEIFIAISKERAQQLIDVSEMLDRSRIGDFSGRIEIEGDPKEERNQLRIMVNDLLQTVDLGLSETLRVLSGFSDKDLTVKMHGEFHGDFKRLKDNVNHSSETLNATLGGIIGHAGQVKEAASVLTTSSDSLSERTQRNAATLEETSAAISAVSDTLQASAQLSHDAKGLSDKARTQADLSRKVVDELVTAMQSIHKYSNDIADIISLIDDVAFQTNLLALNAGVEAARAGEHGRGFAVVASEVRGLAQRTSESASAVKTLISDSATEVKSGVARVDEAGGAIAALVSAIEQVSTCINDISAGAQEQSLSVSEINNALLELDQNTQRNAAMAEETTQQTRQLSNGARAMQQLLQEFSVDQATSHPEDAVYARAS